MSFLARTARLNQVLAAHRLRKTIAVSLVPSQAMHNRALIGSREVVGYGFNGSYSYFDATDMPYPAIRFREETDEIKKLREKEKGDWNKLSISDKKKLYRHSFCLTLSEVDAPTGEWKFHVAIVLYSVSLAFFFFGIARKYFYGPLPESMTPEGKQHQRDLEIKYKANPIFGLASKFDYEKGDWKD